MTISTELDNWYKESIVELHKRLHAAGVNLTQTLTVLVEAEEEGLDKSLIANARTSYETAKRDYTEYYYLHRLLVSEHCTATNDPHIKQARLNLQEAASLYRITD